MPTPKQPNRVNHDQTESSDATVGFEFQVKPEPSKNELEAIRRALAMVASRQADKVKASKNENRRWRFSGRWWAGDQEQSTWR